MLEFILMLYKGKFIFVFLLLLLLTYLNEERDFLGFLKILGCFIAGFIGINIFKIPIPIGGILAFISFTFFFREEASRCRIASVILGILLFFLPLVAENFGGKVNISSSNIATLNLESDFLKIKDKVYFEDKLYVKNFQISYDNSGEILEMNFNLVDRPVIWARKSHFAEYKVSYLKEEKQYNVVVVDTKSREEYDKSMSGLTFIQGIDYILSNNRNLSSLSKIDFFYGSKGDSYDFGNIERIYSSSDNFIISNTKEDSSFKFKFDEFNGNNSLPTRTRFFSY